MFYRFLSKLATQERLEVFPQVIPGSEKDPWGPSVKDYEACFKVVKSKISVKGVQQYQAPKIDEKKYGCCLKFNQYTGEVVLPDVWGVEGCLFVSDLFKSIIEKVDKLKHQYLQVQWIDHNENPIPVTQNYYWFNPLRFLKVTPGERIATPSELGFMPIPGEEDFIARVNEESSLRQMLEQIPIWQHFGQEDIKGRQSPIRSVMYFNQAVYDSLINADVKGMDIYSQSFGIGEESVSAI